MRRRSPHAWVGFYLVTLFSVFGASAFGDSAQRESAARDPRLVRDSLPVAGGREELALPSLPAAVPRRAVAVGPSSSPGTAVGNTYYDYQQNGSTGRQVDEFGGTIQVSWMDQNQPRVSPGRTVNWNKVSVMGSPTDRVLDNGKVIRVLPLGTPATPDGAAFPEAQAGYTNLSLLPDGRAAVVYHTLGGLGTWTAQVDTSFESGLFVGNPAPQPPDTAQTGPVVWPHMAVDIVGADTVVHVVAKANGDGSADPFYYWRGVLSGGSIIWSSPLYMDSITTISPIVETDPSSDAVAIVYSKPLSLSTQTKNDVAYFRSTDGGLTWDGPINVTNYTVDSSNFAYTDLAAIYDETGTLHVVWNTLYYDRALDQVNLLPVELFHWNDLRLTKRLIHAADWENSCSVVRPRSGGAWNLQIAKPSIALKPAGAGPGGGNPDQVLYVTWVQFGPTESDCATQDSSGTPGGYVNGELWMAASSDGGLTWDRAVNITGTETPDCLPGDCHSEHWVTAAARADSGVYLSYVDDTHAGAAVLAGGSDGEWSNSPYMVLALEARSPIPGPTIVVSPRTRSIAAMPGLYDSTFMVIHNLGNMGLTYSVAVTADDGGLAHVRVAGGSAHSGAIPAISGPDTLLVEYDAVGLAPNSQRTWRLGVVSNDPINDTTVGGTPIDVRLDVTVQDPPVITVSPNPLKLTALENRNPDPGKILLSNAGGDTLRCTTATDRPWLTVAPYWVTAPDTLTVTVSVTGLTIGTYFGHVIIYADSAAKTPESVTVNLEVQYNPCPLVAPGDFNNNGSVTSADVIGLINYCFKGGTPPVLTQGGEVDGHEEMNIRDILYLVRFIFGGGPYGICPATQPEYIPSLQITDTLKATNLTLEAGVTSLVIGLELTNQDTISGIALPIKLSVEGIVPTIDSVNWEPRTLVFESRSDKRDSVAGTINIGLFDFGGAALDPGRGTLAHIGISVPPQPYRRLVRVDTLRLPIANSPMLVQPNLDGFVPVFVGFEEVTDADGDGLLDPDDNCPYRYNPNQLDSDGDGAGDACDNCLGLSNSGQADADGDGLGDACDTCTDTDGDGFGNPGYALNTCPTDNCPNVRNAGQQDTDGDGLGDECDTCTDTDGDGYGDPGFFRNTCAKDNCPYVFNPGQSDLDGDGKGDSCDVGTVAFSASPRCGSVPLTVQFTDQSIPIHAITAWLWNFGDGQTSTTQNPAHQYSQPGVYDVKLVVSDGPLKDSLRAVGFVTTQESIAADFTAVPSKGKSPLTVLFDPLLNGIANEYFWDFGDGYTSTTPNPIHKYTQQGRYNVKLRVRLNLDGCDQVDSIIKAEYVVVNNLSPAFAAAPTAGFMPLVVQFTDQSTGNPTAWYWNFGDGFTSSLRNPLHQYNATGVYGVFLRVSNAVGTDSLLKLSYIRVDTPYCDLVNEIYDAGARPGFDMFFYGVWTNRGTSAAASCTLKVLAPPEMTFYDVVADPHNSTGTYTGYSFRGDTIVIPLGTIAPSPWNGGNLQVYGQLSEMVAVGDFLTCKSWLTSSAFEHNLDNNRIVHRFQVTGSIDPNDKLCYPVGEGAEKTVRVTDRLEYLIRFENKQEATAEAIYVRVIDSLDPDLDWSTLSVGAMSHPDACSWNFDPYAGVLSWYCDSIMLPPNVNAPEGEGFVAFAISPRADLPDATVIANTAWIRFDYNPWLRGPEEGPVVRTITHAPLFLSGDANANGTITSSDIIYLVNYVFKSGPEPLPVWQSGDTNCDLKVTSSDIIYLVNYVFKSGPAPGCP